MINFMPPGVNPFPGAGAYQGGMYGQPQYNRPGQVIRVSGIDGAKAFPMMPNESAVLMDENEDIFYFKTTDGAGFPTVRAFSFRPIESQPVDHTQYVTREELDQVVSSIKEMISRAEQPVLNEHKQFHNTEPHE